MKFFRVLIFLFFLSLYNCLGMINDAAQAVSNASENKSETLSESFYNTISVDSIYSLDVPKYMKSLNNLHPDASLQYANIYKEAYTIVIHENKNDFIELFKALDEYDEELSSIENYAIVQKKMLSENIKNLKSMDYGLVSINGYPARQVKMSGQIDNINASYIISYIEGTENIYMIMSWTVANRIENLENTFEYINGSFKLI